MVVVAAAGRIYSLHCTALHCTEERWKVQVHTILYHNDNNETAQSWDGPKFRWRAGELEGGITRGIYGRERKRVKERFW